MDLTDYDDGNDDNAQGMPVTVKRFFPNETTGIKQ